MPSSVSTTTKQKFFSWKFFLRAESLAPPQTMNVSMLVIFTGLSSAWALRLLASAARFADHEVDGQHALALGRRRAVDQADQRLGADPAELGARVLDGGQGRPN